LAFPLPPADISLEILTKIAKVIAKRFVIDVEPFETKNPSVTVVYDTAIVKYQLLLRTHGIPKYHAPVRFTKVRSLGDVMKKAISPSGLGEIDNAMRLKLYTDEMPSNTDVILDVSFEVRVDANRLVTMTFPRDASLKVTSAEIEVVATSNCSFPLEQIDLKVKKATDFQPKEIRITILDKTSHNPKEDVSPRCISKEDDYVKWITSFPPHESLLFKVVGIV
jgi:hypothetical protein